MILAEDSLLIEVCDPYRISRALKPNFIKKVHFSILDRLIFNLKQAYGI